MRCNLTVYLNPFREKTDIRYEICDMGCEQQNVTLQIYDAAGCLVKDFSRQLSAICHQSSVKWNGRDDSGKKLPSGVYFLKFRAGDYGGTRKLLLIR